MRRLNQYKLTVPLEYNTYSLYGENSEFVVGIKNQIVWEENYSIDFPYPLDDGKRFIRNEVIHFSISCETREEKCGEGASYDLPDKRYLCIIDNVVAETKGDALRMVSAFIKKACKALSVMINSANVNKHSYQPRIEMNYHKINWKEEPYLPYDEIVNTICSPPDQFDNEGNRMIQMYVDSSAMHVESSVSSVMSTTVDVNQFDRLYNCNKNEGIEFLIDEYYTALGKESYASKFFHLFTIIEHIESNYIALAVTEKVFSNEEKKKVKDTIDQIDLSADKKNILKNKVCGELGRATVENRNQKLAMILNAMGISSIRNCGTEFTVDAVHMQQLTDLRNKYFHGNGYPAKIPEGYIKLETAVARLLYICEGVINYLLRNSER